MDVVMYDWKRFWHPISESVSLSDDGFLYDPDAELGGQLNPHAVPWERIHDAPCLALLGEPGIGKSTALAQEMTAVADQVAAEGGALLLVDLGEYGDETRLIQEVFSSAEFTRWAAGVHVLHLLLDGLDECRLLIPQVAKILDNQLRKHRDKLNRLRLRIACRTADWPQLLADRLRELWGEGSPGIYALAPLRRVDVTRAAAASGLDGEKFLNELSAAGAHPLAIKPVTLNFLIQTFKQAGALPRSQAELYEQGCRLLCEETSVARQAAGQVGQLSADQRLWVAELIAAATVFCNKSYVCLGGEAGADDVTLADLAGGSIAACGNAFRLDQRALEEVAGTGLFAGGGGRRVKFAHRTYAEFLAASYLAHQPIDHTERMKLIRHADDPAGRIVPQLREAAAWLAGMAPEVFQGVAAADPQVLLRSDIRAADDEERAALLQRLLDLAEAGDLLLWDWADRSHYHKLSHAAIAEQLSPYATDRAKDERVRRFAVDVARACDLADMKSAITDVALDATESYGLRCTAVYALLDIGGGAELVDLKPLALGSAVNDPELRLKAAALQSLWPEHVTSEELFARLAVPPRGTYGPYGYFLSNELPERLSVADLPPALRWAGGLSAIEAHEYSVRDLVAAISRLGWENLDVIDVRSAMIDFAVARLAQNEDIETPPGHDAPQDEQRRRWLAEGVVPRIQDFDKEGLGLLYSAPGLVRDSDVEWMAAKLRAEADPQTASYWAQLIRRAFNPSRTGQLDCVLAACGESEILQREMSPLFAAVALDSAEAARARAQHAEYLKWERERQDRQSPPPLDPPPSARIEIALQECEAGNADAWFYASRDLQLEANSTHFHHDGETDLTELPGWAQSDAPTRARLVQGALKYATECDADGEKWLGTNSRPLGAIWGYKALLLLLKTERLRFEALSPEVWTRWAPIVATFHDHSVPPQNKELHNEIAASCLAKAPEAVRACLETIFSRAAGGDAIFVLPQFVERAWGPEMEAMLCAEMINTEVAPEVTGCLLDLLLEKRSAEARDFALSLVGAPIAAAGDARERARLATTVLLRRADDPGWETIWPAIQGDEAFGKAVLEALAYRDMHNPSLGVRLSEADTAQLFIWLETKYPQAADPAHEGAHIVSPRDAVASYRDGVLRMLRERGTPAAVAALRTIHEALPQLDWMTTVIAEAIRTMLRKTWRPLAPADFLEVTRCPGTRLVQSAAQLQEVILESLGRLQELLQGETPAARDLWDKVSKKRFKPTDENDFSDYIKRHLEMDLRKRGIVSMREVEIRRGRGGGGGERTDIHVTGIVPGANDGEYNQVRVIIEVKGSWHREVDTAMQTQLVDRYLTDNDCAHGVYIVGWYRCALWDSTDRRLKASPDETVAQLHERLERQAASLTNNSQSIRAVALNAALR
jgi:hypothetical protein